MGKIKKYKNGGRFRQALTGIDIDGGGYDKFDTPIASMIPGGGLLAAGAGVFGHFDWANAA